MTTMTDARAERILLAGLNLAVTIRDEGPDAVHTAAEAVLEAAGGDPIAALSALAVAIDPALPLYPWWQRGDRILRPCGTRAAYVRHQRHGEQPCQPCIRALSEHNHKNRTRRQANAA